MFHCIKICVRFQQDFLCICNSGLLCDVVDPGVIMRVWGGRRGKALYLNTGIETHTPHAPPSGEKTRLTEKWINIEENAWDLVADFRSRSGDTCLFRNLCLSRAWERGGETEKALWPSLGQNMLSLEEGSTDYHHCDTIWCLETSPATLLLLPVLQLRRQICGTHHFSTCVSTSCFSVATLEINKFYVGISWELEELQNFKVKSSKK